MGDFERTVREFKRTLTGGRQKTAPLDIMGKVTRVEDGVAWVRFAGSEVGDTPVRMTIDCKEGDVVQVRSSDGKAWIVGNQTAPPTDDSKAKEVEKKTEKFAERIKSVEKVAGDAEEIANAVNQKVWSDEAGLHIADGKQDAAAERNTIWNSLGMLFRKGLNPILGVLTGDNPRVVVYDGNGSDSQNEVASFGSTAVVGQALNGKTRMVTAPEGIDLLRRDNNRDLTLAHFGYDVGIAESGTAVAPYYTFGIRQPESDVGNFSFAEGSDITASGYVSHAEGGNTTASGYISHAEGYSTTASGYVSHAEGYRTTASGLYSHAEGEYTEASGLYSHAEGEYTEASGSCSHAEGYRTTASGSYSHVEGIYNVEDTANTYAHIIGNGKVVDGSIQYSNALTVDWNGTIRTHKNSMKTLLSTASYMNGNQDLTFSEPVSEQLTGIVLVWSFWSGSQAEDWGWETFFIPKAMVQLHDGVGYDCPLSRPKSSYFGHKYVYIYDTHIKGHADNVATGTANNVPYQNNKWVLRYVFGC